MNVWWCVQEGEQAGRQLFGEGGGGVPLGGGELGNKKTTRKVDKRNAVALNSAAWTATSRTPQAAWGAPLSSHARKRQNSSNSFFL